MRRSEQKMKTRTLFRATLVVALCLVALLLCACERRTGKEIGNELPHVKVSGGPPQGSASTYSVPIYWFGWDVDGVVDHFVYAIDDTTEWIETRFFQGSFLFMADTLRPEGDFGTWHTFYIKAVDDDGAFSRPDLLTFDARTVAPTATIQSPRCDPDGLILCQGALPLGTSVKIVWTGDDPDSRDPRKQPVAYIWRLFNTSLINPYFGVEDDSLLLNMACGEIDETSCWSEPMAETQIQFRSLAERVFWQFGVRAIDEAGAVEPRLRMNYNVIFFKTLATFGSPELRVYEGSSQFNFPENGMVWERQAAINKPITFGWVGDASVYGGTISGYQWGCDIEDLEDPEQWETGWSAEIVSATVLFDKPGVHYFYVRVKDYADTEQLGIVMLDVIDFVFDRDILYVDDYFDGSPTDPYHDQFVAQMLSCAKDFTDSIYVYPCWLPGLDGYPLEMTTKLQTPPLSTLCRYRFVIWDVNCGVNAFVTGIWRSVSEGIIDVYLKGGGRLWIYGFQIVRGSHLVPANFVYPGVPDGLSFPGRFLRLSGTVNRPIVNNTMNTGDGFRGGIPNRQQSDRLPQLELNYALSVFNNNYFGLGSVEAVMTAMGEQDLSQRPDTLYFYRANYPTSTYNMKACGFQFLDIYTGSKVVYLGFPMHLFLPTGADSLGCYVTDWMFEDIGW
jgi:hypothetical protein